MKANETAVPVSAALSPRTRPAASQELAGVRADALRLLAYCRSQDWAGYDPYDALNSRLFQALPLLNRHLPRLALTQLNKRSPLNVRPLLLVPKTQNPKGLALFLAAMLRLSRAGVEEAGELARALAERLAALRSAGEQHWCWGYSFPWQTRTVLIPRHAPNLVCTCFVAQALLDLWEETDEERFRAMALSAVEYIADVLFWEKGEVASFSYPAPSVRLKIHNANFLGAALLCRAYKLTGEPRFLERAFKATRCSAREQQPDGSWFYSESSAQRWIDNFHTGFNLCALRQIGDFGSTREFEPNLRLGFACYRQHFFREDGAPRYFQDCTFPIDVHSVAQSIITLLFLRDLAPGNVELAHRVLNWAMNNLWDQRGFFYYQQRRYGTVRISYMRWGQAWMMLALATVLETTLSADE